MPNLRRISRESLFETGLVFTLALYALRTASNSWSLASCVPLLTLILVATLIARRRGPRFNGSPKTFLSAMPSIVISIIAVGLATKDNIEIVAISIAAIGLGLSFVSLIYLGKSFGILPAHRGVVEAGPYRFVRHPIYLGEFLLVVACLWNTEARWAIPLALALLVALWMRINAEESILGQDKRYVAYQCRTKSKLVPFVW